MDISDLLPIAIFAGANFAAACSGAFFKPDEWYENLSKPSWQPPSWLFPVVWTPLYIIMAVSGWMIWRDAEPGIATLPLAIYGAHLVFNFLWSALFFGLKRMDWALFEIVFLWATLVGIIVTFHPINPTAAYIMLPYLVWASFAAYLNFVVLRMNTPPLSKAN